MGQVTVSFLGVCTIFQNLPGQVGHVAPPGTHLPQNRVVLARTTMEFMQFSGVDLHVAKLQLRADSITLYGPPLPPAAPPFTNTYGLDGVELSILNAASTQLTANLGCLPSLQAQLTGISLGPPAQSVYIPDAAKVQAWFDVPGGSAQGYLMRTNPPCPTVPSIAVLTMETSPLAGMPDTVLLRYAPWYGTAPTIVALHGANPEILVMNFADGEAFVDDDNDFLLNYTLAESFPPLSTINVPTANACLQWSPGIYSVNGCGDAGPGCSSTNFP